MKKGSVFALVFIAALILIAFASVYMAFTKTTFFDKHNPFKKDQAQSTESAATNSTSGSSGAIISGFKTNNFTKRQLDVSQKFFFNFNYPNEIKSIPDDQLVDMKCTYGLYKEESGFIAIDYSSNPESVNEEKGKLNKNDKFISPLFEKVKDFHGLETDYINYCITENSQEIISYRNTSSNCDPCYGSDSTGKVYFSTLSKTGITEIAKMDDGAYFSCGTPILMTKQQKIYYICSGGDTAKHAFIERVDLVSKKAEEIYSCFTDTPGIDPAPPKCEGN